MMLDSLPPRRASLAFGLRARAAFGALALALVAGGMAAPALAKDAQPAYSPQFMTAAGPFQTELNKDKSGKPDAATVDKLKGEFAAVVTAATKPEDKYAAGSFAISLGSWAGDAGIQQQGVRLMLDSGKAPADQLPKLHFCAGQFAYQANDYATAQTELQTAIAAGYTGSDAYIALAESQFQTNQVAAGLASLQKAIDAEKASGQPVPDAWYKRGLGFAYKAKLASQVASLGAGLVEGYPTVENWQAAIETLRDAANYQAREEIDLLRLMGRTNAYATANDYLEYVQVADPRRLPGEAQAVINAGLASGKLTKTQSGVDEAEGIINGRIAADKASMPALFNQAQAGGASVAVVTGAGDAMLNYGMNDKAVVLYKLALTKPGAEADLLNMRLGIAQADAGDYAGAQASFAKVGGVRQPLAVLWGAYALNKAAGK